MQARHLMDHHDHQWLRDFAERSDEQCFARLVERHTPMVHAAALRQVRNHALAREVSQAVFLILARKAASLGRTTSLPGWLIRTTHYVARNALRAEARRLRRESESQSMTPEPSSKGSSGEPEARWESLAGDLDAGLNSLRQPDRDALVLRFFRNKSLREIGSELGLGEDAARKRIARALERLRAWLEKRDLHITTSSLALMMSTHGPAHSTELSRAAELAASPLLPVTAAALALETMKCLTRKKLAFATVALVTLLLGSAGLVHIAMLLHAPPQTRAADRIRVPGTVILEITGTPGARFTGQMRVGGKSDGLRNGVLPTSPDHPFTLEFPGRPFELDLFLTEGPGNVEFKARTAEGTLGVGSVSDTSGVRLNCSEGELSVSRL